MKKIYAVGGQIRDELLGLKPKDRDFLCVGYTEKDMLDLGFSKVGADFPVYLHPTTGEEYALARRERSTGPGYNDFEVEFSPDVTIDEDLYRRDFTMNAIAKDIETDKIIDPFDGIKHIKERMIHITHNESFQEDPVRLLRMARFKAQYPAFWVSAHTKNQALLANIDKATAERVNLELIKALMGLKPSLFFDTLYDLNKLWFWFPEISDLKGVPQPIRYHAEGCAYTHTMMVLDSAARHNENLEIRFGALVHDLGKALTWPSKLPSHPGHEEAGVPLVHEFCDRLKISNDLRNAGALSAKHHMRVHLAHTMKAKAYVKAFEDFKKNDKDSWTVARVAWHDNEGKLPYENHGSKSWDFHNSMNRIREAKLSAVYTPEEIETMSIETRKNKLNQLRILAFNGQFIKGF